MLVIISGPSGCGKSTLVREVRRMLPGLKFSVSHTTRRRRASEREGVDYRFVTRKAFERMLRKKTFAEWARVHGQLYGTSWEELRKTGARDRLILDIDVQGARQIKDRIPDVVTVFIVPPDHQELRRRLRLRKEDTEAAIERRLADAGEELRAYPEFDYAVINDDLGRAAEELKSIVIASGCRMPERKRKIGRILKSFSGGPARIEGRKKRKA